MASIPFAVSVRNTTRMAILDLHGEINGQADQVLVAAYAEAIVRESTPGQTSVALNFSAVNYINSTGIALIVGLLAEARKTKRQLKVYGLSEHYMEIFYITRLADFMQIFPDERSALQEP